MSRQEAERLARERAAHRAATDFAEADALRERIRELGFEVVDRSDGYELVEMEPSEPRRPHPDDVDSVLDRPPTVDWSVHWLTEGWPDDVLRGIASFRKGQGDRQIQHLVVEAAPGGTWPEDVEVVALADDPGFGAARNAGLRRSAGRNVMVVDGSIEADGDVFGPLEEALADGNVGICGPVCVVTDDLREFHEAPGPDVDAVEAYLMAFRRSVLERGVAFDPKFRFYRAADLDLSFQVKALGLGARRVDVPIRRHEHRRWLATPEDQRRRLSKRNFYRFLDRFRGRTDLLVGSRHGER